MFSASRMYPNGFHPIKLDRNRNFKGAAKAYTRTQRPPIYYFIDFGLSRQYTSRNVTDEPLRGGDKTAPEHRSKRRCNPFLTDIYYIGNLVRQEFMEVRPVFRVTHSRNLTRLSHKKCYGFEFIEDLINSMTHEDPARRPRIEEVLKRFIKIRESLSKSKLRSPIVSRKSPKVLGLIQRARQSIRTVQSMVSGHPSIPDPHVQYAQHLA